MFHLFTLHACEELYPQQKGTGRPCATLQQSLTSPSASKRAAPAERRERTEVVGWGFFSPFTLWWKKKKIKGMLRKLTPWKGEENLLKGLFGKKIVPPGTLLWQNCHPELLPPEPAGS